MNKLRPVILLVGLAVMLFTAAGWFGWRLLAYDASQGSTSAGEPDERRIQVIFQSHVLGGLPVRFSPQQRVQFVTPGVEQRNVYEFHNLSDETVYFTPVHAVAPADAARHYSMSVCFCFYDQKMPPRSKAEFTIVYTLDPGLSRRTNPVIINYNLKKIDADQFRRTPSPHDEGSEIIINEELSQQIDEDYRLQPDHHSHYTPMTWQISFINKGEQG